VVAVGERVVADLAKREGVVEGDALVETRLELRAGEEVVARREQDRAATPCLALGRLALRRIRTVVVDESREPCDAAEGGVARGTGEPRLAVVVVQDRQLNAGSALSRAAALLAAPSGTTGAAAAAAPMTARRRLRVVMGDIRSPRGQQ